MIDKFNKYRKINGYIDLNTIPKEIIAKKVYGSRKDKFWFDYEGNEYLFKPNMNQEEDIREIINEELAKILEINNAEYDLEIHNDIYTYIEALKKSGESSENIHNITEELLKRHILDNLFAQRDRNKEKTII